KAEPGAAAQVPDDSMAVRQPEAAELLGPDDLDVDATAAHVLDRVRDETAGRVGWAAWVRRREDGDAHQRSTRNTAYPCAPFDSWVSRGCLHAAQYDGSGETCRKSRM